MLCFSVPADLLSCIIWPYFSKTIIRITHACQQTNSPHWPQSSLRNQTIKKLSASCWTESFLTASIRACHCFLFSPHNVTHRYTLLQEKEEAWPILSGPTLKYVIVLRKCKEKQCFCGHNTLKYGLLLIQLSGKAGISVWWFVRVTANCIFTSDT